MTEYEYVYPFPTTWTRTEFEKWRERCTEMQGWCNTQGFNWYYEQNSGNLDVWGTPGVTLIEGGKFSFEQPEDLTLFLLRWA